MGDTTKQDFLTGEGINVPQKYVIQIIQLIVTRFHNMAVF